MSPGVDISKQSKVATYFIVYKNDTASVNCMMRYLSKRSNENISY